MRTLRSSILTLLLVAWTAIESGTVALTHSHLDCGDACGASCSDTTHASKPACTAGGACQHQVTRAATQYQGQSDQRQTSEHRAARRLNSSHATSTLTVRGSAGQSHPDDCTICRHLGQARIYASDLRLSLAPESTEVVDSELPPAPFSAAPSVLYLRGPPGRLSHC